MMPGMEVDYLPMDMDTNDMVNTNVQYNPSMEAQISQQQADQRQPQQPQQQQQPQAQQPQQQPQQENGVENVAAAVEALSGPGAGPLPTGFGAQPNANGGSTLTEFTKRRNWSQRVLEELKDFLHILTPDGRILYASPSAEQLTGYKPDELVGKFIVDFIHQDDSAIFVREFNESIASGHTLRFFYRFRKSDSNYTIFESHGHPHLSSEAVAYRATDSAAYCRGFFMMARPYPTKNASLLDSFLEHKIENERLTRRIADLKREEREEDEAQQRQWANGQASLTPSDSRGNDSGSPSSSFGLQQDQASMLASNKISNNALTQKNLTEANEAFEQDSINDKMARFEGNTYLETIEMLTGLQYRDGERSQGISTGDASPALIRGDAGIAISADKDGRGGDKKKKLKVADEYVCTDCGTLDSPEWRKGPSGPKTLCNACGRELCSSDAIKPETDVLSSAMGQKGEKEVCPQLTRRDDESSNCGRKWAGECIAVHKKSIKVI